MNKKSLIHIFSIVLLSVFLTGCWKNTLKVSVACYACSDGSSYTATVYRDWEVVESWTSDDFHKDTYIYDVEDGEYWLQVQYSHWYGGSTTSTTNKHEVYASMFDKTHILSLVIN